MVKELSINAIWDILKTVPDPEIPSISIVDLGIVRDVQFNDDMLEIKITPTYSGCPAMSVIKGEDCSLKSKIRGFHKTPSQIMMKILGFRHSIYARII